MKNNGGRHGTANALRLATLLSGEPELLPLLCTESFLELLELLLSESPLQRSAKRCVDPACAVCSRLRWARHL